MIRATSAVALALALSATACKREVDQQAKSRIFSPEEPVGAQAGAQEKLDSRALADDPKLAARVLHMGREEAAHRLGSHQVESHVSFAWQRGAQKLLPDGGPDQSDAVELDEQATLQQAGTGDFQLKLENSRSQGFELVSAQGGVYVRGLFGPFRKRRTDRTDPVRLREQALSGLPTFDRLARGLKLRRAGEGRVGGRATVRYQVIGGETAFAAAKSDDLPKVQYPEPAGGQGKAGAPDPDTARRLELWQKEKPAELSGSIEVDAQSAVPLAAQLTGRFRVDPPKPSEPPAELTVTVQFATKEVGVAVAVKPPPFEPDPSTPHAVKDPLRFLGKAAAPAGVPSAEEAVEDDEAPTDEPPAEAPPAQRTEKPAEKPTGR